MSYRKPLHNSRKFFSPFYSPTPTYSMNSAGSLQNKDFLGIPLPNEKETSPEYAGENKRVPSLAEIIQYVRRHIRIEEIILIGLIILMLDESIEDDLLLIILIYILLF